MCHPLVRLNIIFNLGNPNIQLKMRERERERERESGETLEIRLYIFLNRTSPLVYIEGLN